MEAELDEILSGVDAEKFISMVKQHPVLYDISHPAYKLRTVRRRAWDEIGTQLYPNWDRIKEKDKKGKVCKQQTYHSEIIG